MGKLSAITVKALRFPADKTRPVRFGDGDGLYLQVAPGDTKSWLFRYTLRAKAHEMGLGAVGDAPDGVSLAKARILAGEMRAKLRTGVDPINDRRAARLERVKSDAEAREQTFRAAATALVDSKRAGWRTPKHAAQWLATLETHAFPVIGDLPVAAIGTDDVLKVLRPIWERIPETASRLRQRIEAVLDSARVKGWRTGDNPARWRGHLAGELPQPGKVKRVRHRPALGWQKIGALVRRIEGLPNAVLHLAFSPDGGRLAAMLGGDNGLRVYIGARGWDEVARDTQYSDESHGTAFSSDGSLATTSYDRKIRLYAADIVGSTQPIVVTKAPNGDLPFGIAFSPDGARLAIGYVDATTVDVVDARTLSPLLAWKSDGTQYGSLSTVAWSRNGRTLFAAGRYEQEGSVPARLECNQPWRTKGAADLQDYSDEPHSIVRRGSSCRWARSLARPASTRWDAALGARAAVGRFSCPAQDTLRFR